MREPVNNHQRELALGRTPTISMSANGYTGRLNSAGAELLTKEGDEFFAICRKSDGRLILKPVVVPRGTIAVNRIYRHSNNSYVLSLGCKLSGIFEMAWDRLINIVRLVPRDAEGSPCGVADLSEAAPIFTDSQPDAGSIV